MAEISGSRVLYTTLNTMQSEMRDLMAGLHSQIRDVLLNNATGQRGTIPQDQAIPVRAEIGSLVDATFTGTIPGQRGRYAFGRDGVTPLAEYPRLLNKWIGAVTYAVVNHHATYMRRVMPDDVQQALTFNARVSEQSGLDQPLDDDLPDLSPRPLAGPSSTSSGVSGLSAKQRAFLRQYDKLRLFRPNPLAEYEGPHTWVDPQGYRLSDRIWNTSQAVRMKIDRLVAQAINEGMSAVDLARQLEQYLLPNRKLITTIKPYGKRYGTMSFDAMRLARSEIARAHGMAAKLAAIANPYVETMIWVLSMSHPKIDICDQRADDSPYPVDDTPVPVEDSHPQCLCHLRGQVSRTPAQVTAELREALREAEQLNLRPYATPLQVALFTELLLGTARYMLSEAFGIAA